MAHGVKIVSQSRGNREVLSFFPLFIYRLCDQKHLRKLEIQLLPFHKDFYRDLGNLSSNSLLAPGMGSKGPPSFQWCPKIHQWRHCIETILNVFWDRGLAQTSLVSSSLPYGRRHRPLLHPLPALPDRWHSLQLSACSDCSERSGFCLFPFAPFSHGGSEEALGFLYQHFSLSKMPSLQSRPWQRLALSPPDSFWGKMPAGGALRPRI